MCLNFNYQMLDENVVNLNNEARRLETDAGAKNTDKT